MPGNSLSDKACAEDVLCSQKFFSSNYNIAVTEAANSELRKDLTNIQQQDQDAAQQAFQLMSQKGWYQVAPAEQQKITDARNKAQQEMSAAGVSSAQQKKQPSHSTNSYQV
jgi:spore coat protein CotF